jgi:hypothetical protein
MRNLEARPMLHTLEELGRIGTAVAQPDAVYLSGKGKKENEVVMEVLQDALDEQMLLMASGRFDNFRGQKDEAFLKIFSQDPLFTDLLKEAQAMAPWCSDNDVNFQRRVNGAVFERIAYAFLSSVVGPNVPIMGDSIVKISKALHPQSDVDDFGLGQIGIRGAYVPDGYILRALNRKPKIAGILECKFVKRQGKAAKQQRESVDELRRLGSIVDPDPYFVVVSPSFEEPVTPRIETDLIPVPIPFSLLKNSFFQDVYYRYAFNGGRTLAQIRLERQNGFSRQRDAYDKRFLRQA